MALTVIDDREPRRSIDYEARIVNVPPNRVHVMVPSGEGWTTTHPDTGEEWTIPLEPNGKGGFTVATPNGAAAMLVGRTWVEGCTKLGVDPRP